MSDRDKSKEELIGELASLRQELAELKIYQQAFEVQSELTASLAGMEKTATGMLLLRAMLLQILQSSNRLAQAEIGSLFLLDSNGVVTESILARGATMREQKQTLIGTVLDRGLAGWVSRYRQVGLIEDTERDERWLTLPNQPYNVRSALCVPLQKGKTLLGVLTLMHPLPYHFTVEMAKLMEAIAPQLTLILDNTQFVAEIEPSEPQLQEVADLSTSNNLSLIGLYIITADCKFLYANFRLAEMFDYPFGELVALESITRLLVAKDCEFIGEQIKQCFQGQMNSIAYAVKGQQRNGELIDVDIQGEKTKFYGKSVMIGTIRSI